MEHEIPSWVTLTSTSDVKVDAQILLSKVAGETVVSQGLAVQFFLAMEKETAKISSSSPGQDLWDDLYRAGEVAFAVAQCVSGEVELH